MQKHAELVFIPAPGMGHLTPTVELAKKIVHHSQQISISILVMKFPLDKTVSSYIHSLETDPSPDKSNRIKFVDLPQPDNLQTSSFFHLAESYKPIIRDIMKKRANTELTQRLAGFVVGIFSTTVIDVANELGIPSYLFYTSNASFLNMMLYSQSLNDDHGVDVVNEFNKPDIELHVPGFENMVPAKVLSSIFLQRETTTMVLNSIRRYRETKGILVNSFVDLEPHVFRSLHEDDKIPPVYHVGPIINVGESSQDQPYSQPHSDQKKDSIMQWLDRQPQSSVVFLCFGSKGSFNEDQVKEIAIGLWRIGHRFLWSLRRPGKMGPLSEPVEYESEELRKIMPNGFLDKTIEIGKVIGWAPQIEILAHPSIGAFVSHCGWNSTLESLWFGVPILTWPLYAEQYFNAFQLAKEFGLAVEIEMDYKRNVKKQKCNVKVTAEEVEAAVKKVMEDRGGDEVRRNVKDMKLKARAAITEDGSSYASIRKFIDDVINHMTSPLHGNSVQPTFSRFGNVSTFLRSRL